MLLNWCICKPLGAACPSCSWGCFYPLPCSRLRCSNTGSCLGAELLGGQALPPCVQSCLSHAGWWQGMRFAVMGSDAKEPPGFLPLSGVLDLASYHDMYWRLSLTRKEPLLEPPVQTSCSSPSQDYGNKPSSCLLVSCVTPHGAASLLLLWLWICHAVRLCCFNQAVNGFRAGTVWWM